MRKILFAASLLAALPASGFCGATSFGNILQTEPSVRANGMGDAYTAADGDLFGAYYNPAQSVSTPTAGATFQRGYTEDSTGVIGVAKPDAAFGLNVAASLMYYNAGDINLYTDQGAEQTVSSEKDYVGLLNASKRFGVYSFGANIKYAHTSLFEAVSDNTLAFDFGAKADLKFFSLGAAVQNIGAAMKLGDETEYVPVTWRAGAYRGFDFNKAVVNVACDFVKTADQPGAVNVGGELVYHGMLAVRTGYEFRNSVEDANELRFGFGLTLKNLSLDYALVPYNGLGATNRFAVTYKFGARDNASPETEQAAMPQATPAPVAQPAAATPVATPPATPATPAAIPAPAAASAANTTSTPATSAATAAPVSTGTTPAAAPASAAPDTSATSSATTATTAK
jgi:hypothetical protein